MWKGRQGDHVSVTVRGTLLSVCEHGEEPIFLPQHPLFSGLGKEAEERVLDVDQHLGS